MILFDLLKATPKEEIFKFLITESAKEKYIEFIDNLLSLNPAQSETEYLVGTPVKDRFMSEGEQTEFLDISMYELNDIKASSRIIKEIIPSKPEAEMTDDEVKEFFDKYKKLSVNGYAFEFTNWESVLGWHIHEENLKNFDKAQFLAIVIDEMSFTGFDREDQAKVKDDLEKRVEEAKKAMESPEGRENYFIPAEKVFAELGIEDTRTEEEKAEGLKIMYRDMVYNMQNLCKSLSVFFEE